MSLPSQELQQIATGAGVATPLGQDVGAGSVDVDTLNQIVADRNRPVGETIQPLIPNAPTGGYQAPALQGGNEFESNYASYLQNQMGQNTNVSDIRGEMIGMFQDRINALDQVYNDRLRQSAVQGQGRVGQGTAVLARRGLAGSPRGGAIQEGILEQNRDIDAAINNERNTAIAAIHGEASKMAVEEAQNRREAVERGSKAYLDLLKTQDERRETNVNRIAASLVAQGIDPNTMDPGQLQEIAKQIGVRPEELIGSWAPLAAMKAEEDEEKQRKIDMENKKFELDEWKAEIDGQYKMGNLSLAEARLAHDEALGWYNAEISAMNAQTNRMNADTTGQFTLGADQVRFDAEGNEIARGVQGSGANPTQHNLSSAGYARRAMEAHQAVETIGFLPGITSAGSLGEKIPNRLRTVERQQYEQAQRNFVNAVLRQESGAVINQDEFENARQQYFPQPGDNPATVQQKSRNRQTAINNLNLSAGPVAPMVRVQLSDGRTGSVPRENFDPEIMTEINY